MKFPSKICYKTIGIKISLQIIENALYKHMHVHGLVNVISILWLFQSNDSARLFFIAGHKYKTKIINNNRIHNIPDNPYSKKDPNARAGSKMPDLCAYVLADWIKYF